MHRRCNLCFLYLWRWNLSLGVCCTLEGDQARRCVDCLMAGASSCLRLGIVLQELPFFAWPVVSFGKVIFCLKFLYLWASNEISFFLPIFADQWPGQTLPKGPARRWGFLLFAPRHCHLYFLIWSVILFWGWYIFQTYFEHFVLIFCRSLTSD